MGKVDKEAPTYIIFVPFLAYHIPDDFLPIKGSLQGTDPKKGGAPFEFNGVLSPQVPRTKPGAAMLKLENDQGNGDPGIQKHI